LPAACLCCVSRPVSANIREDSRLLARARRGHNFGNFRGLIQFRLPLTQDVIADATGLTSVHVNRILQKLRADRLINLSRGELALLDVERLKKLDGFDPNYLHRERLHAA